VTDKHDREDLRITIGEFKKLLSVHNDSDLLDFCGLDFYRLKRRADKVVQVEFNQSVYRNDKGRVVVENHE